MERSLKEAAALLEIAPATLRKWSAHFAIVLSDSTRQSLTAGGALQRHYTEDDIAILRQAKTLLRSGYTYDQVRHELAGEPIAGQPADRADIGDSTPAISGDALGPLSAARIAGEHVFAQRDETIAELERTIQTQQIQIDQLYADLLKLQLENQALRGQARPRRAARTSRLPYRLGIILTLCSIVVLVGIALILFFDPDAFRNAGGVYIAPTALPVRAADGVDEQRPSALPSLAPLMPATPKPSPAATETMPTAGPAPAAVVLQQVAAAEATLQTGEFSATIDYGDGTRSAARMRFDLGDGQRVSRFHITSTYAGGSGVQTVERITIGDQSWQRQPDGIWIARSANESVEDQVRVFLPHADSIVDPTRETSTGDPTLHWYDADYDANIMLIVDLTTGIPRELRRVSRAADTILTVTYTGWNTVVEITPPSEA